MFVAVDLAPAWIALAGVLVGSTVPIATEAWRWRRERSRQLHERRQDAMIDVLRQSAIVVHDSAGVAELMSLHGRAATLDMRSIDAAVVAMSQSIDVFRVLGPSDMVGPLTDLFCTAVDIKEATLRNPTPEGHQALAQAAYEAKLAVVETAKKHGLAN